MNQILATFIIAFGVLLLAAMGMGIGWLLKGKPLERGCGKKPGTKTTCDDEEASCPLCDPNYYEKQKGKHGTVHKRETGDNSTDV